MFEKYEARLLQEYGEYGQCMSVSREFFISTEEELKILKNLPGTKGVFVQIYKIKGGSPVEEPLFRKEIVLRKRQRLRNIIKPLTSKWYGKMIWVLSSHVPLFKYFCALHNVPVETHWIFEHKWQQHSSVRLLRDLTTGFYPTKDLGLKISDFISLWDCFSNAHDLKDNLISVLSDPKVNPSEFENLIRFVGIDIGLGSKELT